MSNEKLTLWLSHQPVPLGTGYLTEIAEVIRGTVNELYIWFMKGTLHTRGKDRWSKIS